jgi:hypothetical protein
MRIGLKLFSLFALSALPASGFAQNSGWQVQPAPPSWGQPAPQTQDTRPAPRRQPTRGQVPIETNTTMTEAVTCAAALQLATMAAPNWGNERGITNITNAWLQKVFALGENQGISGDRVPALVETEMQRQIDTAADDPNTLSRRAFDCASRQP